MNIYLDQNFPLYLVKALRYLHSINKNDDFKIYWGDTNLSDLDTNQTVVFLCDYAKKGIEITTEKHFTSGYKVFAFKFRTVKQEDDFNLFKLSMRVLTLWEKILGKIRDEEQPFLYTYGYGNNQLKNLKKKNEH